MGAPSVRGGITQDYTEPCGIFYMDVFVGDVLRT